MIDLEAIVSRYKPHLDANNMHIYASQPHEDFLLLKWWMKLQETGDIERLIIPESRPLKSFFKVYAQPTVLIYAYNDGEITQAMWASPADQTAQHHVAYTGVWCVESQRGTMKQLNFTATAYSLIFEFYHAFLGITWQQDLLDVHIKLGYDIVGCVPNLHDQPFCYLVHLTREKFLNSRLYKTYQRTLERR